MDLAASAAQTLAIVLGGVWAYFKFLRGRTFAKRAEVTLATAPLAGPTEPVRVTASLKNVGLSKLPLRLAVLTVSGVYPGTGDGEDPLATSMRALGRPRRILGSHRWVEAGETVVDEAIVQLPSEPAGNVLGYRIEFRAVEQRRWRKGGLSWTTSTVLSANGSRKERPG